MIKLNVKQKEKLELIKAYLNTEIGSGGLCLADNNATSIWFITGIYSNATGIYIKETQDQDRLEPFQITQIFNAGKKGDEDFKAFLESTLNN